MPGWPSAAQRRELGSFPGYAGPEDVERFFELSPEDLRWVLAHRGDARLGVAVQLCSLRWLGFVPDLLAELPRPALLALAEQVESDPDDLMLYGARSQTRTDHFQTARVGAGFRAFDQVRRAALEEWLGLRAIEHERPKALWELCCEHMLAERIVRPAVDTLVRLIAAARERAHVTTHELLSPQLKRGRPRKLDRLLDLREPGGVTWLEWLRTPADSGSPAAIRGQVEKYLHLDRLCAGEVDLSMLAPGRVRMLALEGKRRAAWEIARLAAVRRHPLLLVFIAQMFVERGDELIERYCSAIQNVERRARIAVSEQRDTTSRARDQRSELAGTLSRILLDALGGGEDPLARALREVGEPVLRDCVEDPDALSKPIDEQRREAQHARHSQLAQFAPLVLGALDLKAARGYEPLLDAVRYSNRNRDKPLLTEAPLDVLPAVWRRWALNEDGEVVRTRYQLALWIQARDALRARGLYRACSHRYGDPASWMMPRVQWLRERGELAAVFNRPVSAQERLAQLERQQRELARQLQEGYEQGERVLYDGLRLTGEPPSERQMPESKLAKLAPRMLPEVQYAQLLVDVNRDVPFLEELAHYGQGARSPVRQGQLVGALLANIFGVGNARMSLACGYTERELREAASRHFTEENLDAANAAVVQALRLLPHEWIADLLMTSSDGQRYETIGRSPIAGFAARHTGFRRRMLTWLLWITGEYGHFGGKVIPVTEHESWHTLDPLVHLDTPQVQHVTDTHGNTELTFGISDLLGWELFARFSDPSDRRLHLLGEPDPHVAAELLLTRRANRQLIQEQYEELQRIAGSIKRGWIAPSLLISQMATDPKPDRTGRALREYGRVIETNFILRWGGDPALRARTHAQLNKGENANALRRALGHGNRGRVRARDPETVHRQFECRRLGANCVHYWNTKYLALVLTELERHGLQIPDGEIAGVHNAQHEHINLIGYHDINLHAGPRKGNHRPLRQPAELRTLLDRPATNRTATNA
jgi:TnpA family transposase